MLNCEIELIFGGKLRVSTRAEVCHARRLIRERFGARLFQRSELPAERIVELVAPEQREQTIAELVVLVDIVADVAVAHLV